MIQNKDISESMTIKLEEVFDELPDMPEFIKGIRRAPNRDFNLSRKETGLALKNALRYIPEKWHKKLAPEFLDELLTTGRIYGYRFRPHGKIKGRSIDEYKGRCIEGKAFQVMIDNNLDFDIALYPYELVTYGETGRPHFENSWLMGMCYFLFRTAYVSSISSVRSDNTKWSEKRDSCSWTSVSVIRL